MTTPSTCAIFALYGYMGSTFTTFCGGRTPTRRMGVGERGGGGGGGRDAVDIVRRSTPFGTPPSTTPGPRGATGSCGVSGVIAEGGSSGAASDDTAFCGAVSCVRGGGGGTSITLIGIAPTNVIGARGTGSGPTASSSATTTQVTTIVCATTEQILNSRGITSSRDFVSHHPPNELSRWTPWQHECSERAVAKTSYWRRIVQLRSALPCTSW